MRRKEREMREIKGMLDIIEGCKHCRVGLCVDDRPYIVPLNYGYSYRESVLTLYFHSAKEGKKIDIIKRNNKACFEIDCDTELIEGVKACSYGYQYRSVVGFGEIVLLETNEEKKDGLNRIMQHQTGKVFSFEDSDLEKVLVYKMKVNELTGKERK